MELQCIDITHATATMAKFMSAPRQGHMVGVLCILAYLHHHIQSKIVADPEHCDWSHKAWTQAKWKEFYPDAMEPIPDNAPEARGKPVQINLFCDAARATCLITRRSTTGIIIFLNGMPILWYSKWQNTLESSTFGSEFMALHIAIEMNDALRIKLHMLGIPIDGLTNGFCDNESVVKNASIPESRLSKKHNAIVYHKVRESCACNSICICHEPGKMNLSDVLTKFLPSATHKQCITRILKEPFQPNRTFNSERLSSKNNTLLIQMQRSILVFMSTMFKLVGIQTCKIKFASFKSCKKHALTETSCVSPLMFHPYFKSKAPYKQPDGVLGFYPQFFFFKMFNWMI